MPAAAPGIVASAVLKIAQIPDPDDIQEIIMYIQIAQYAIYALLILLALAWFPLRIRSTADKWLRKDALIPLTLAGEWQHGICECWCDIGGCCLAYFFPGCLRAETWYRAGWPQQCLGMQDPCQAFFGGLFLVFTLLFCPCFNPCINGFLRGGCGDLFAEEMSGGKTFEMRFGIEGNYGLSCIYWWCCNPCVLWQEWKQVTIAVHHEKTLLVGLPVMAPAAQQSMGQGMEMASAPAAPAGAAPYL